MSRRSNGEGSLYQRKDGRWCASVRFVDPVTGERVRRVFYGATKTAARQKMREARKRIEAGAPVKDSTATVAAWLAEWRVTALEASGRAVSTKNVYATLSRQHLEPAPFGLITLERLRRRTSTGSSSDCGRRSSPPPRYGRYIPSCGWRSLTRNGTA